MLVSDITPINSGNAFIIDVNSFSNYRTNMKRAEFDYQLTHSFPNNVTPLYESKKITATHLFRTSLTVIDHHPTTTEVRDYTVPFVKEFFTELQNIAKNQPIYFKVTVPTSVNDIDSRELDLLIPVFFRNGNLYTGDAMVKVPFGVQLNLTATVAVSNTYITWYGVNTHIGDTSNYYLIAGMNLIISLKNLA